MRQRDRPFERTRGRAICGAGRKGQAFDNELPGGPCKPPCASRNSEGLHDEEYAWSVLRRCETIQVGRQLVPIRRREFSCSSPSKVHEVHDVQGIEREASEVARVTLSLDMHGHKRGLTGARIRSLQSAFERHGLGRGCAVAVGCGRCSAWRRGDRALETTEVGLVGEPGWLQPAAIATQKMRNGASRAFIGDFSFVEVSSLGRREMRQSRVCGAILEHRRRELPSTPGEKNVEFLSMRNWK